MTAILLPLTSCTSTSPGPKPAATAEPRGKPFQVNEAEMPVFNLMRQAAGAYGPGPKGIHDLGEIEAGVTDSGKLTATLLEDGRTLQLQGSGKQALLMQRITDRRHYATWTSSYTINCALRLTDFKYHPQGEKPEQLEARSVQGCTLRGEQRWGPVAEWEGRTGQYSANQWPRILLINSPAGFKIIIMWPTEAIKLNNPYTAQVRGVTAVFWRK